jgi:hypothetical protein
MCRHPDRQRRLSQTFQKYPTPRSFPMSRWFRSFRRSRRFAQKFRKNLSRLTFQTNRMFLMY